MLACYGAAIYFRFEEQHLLGFGYLMAGLCFAMSLLTDDS